MPQKKHRPEIEAYIETCRGKAVSCEQFVAGYKALGLPRTAPTKGRMLYKFLIETGVISKPI